MMGSPYYYDVLFDDGPGDVVFHDCMWSGICTCCIQLLHQDYSYESPDLKDLNFSQQLAVVKNELDPRVVNKLMCANDTTTPTTATSTTLPLNNNSLSTNCGDKCAPTSNTPSSVFMTQHQPQSSQLPLATTTTTDSIANLSTTAAAAASTAKSTTTTTSNLTTSITSTITQANHHKSSHGASAGRPSAANSAASSPSSPDTNSSSSSSSTTSSNSTSPKPVRRREHNDSERKRRDHLRNAFNFLRDQVPRFKAINKKPPRIQILHEATKYVQNIIRDSLDLDKRLAEERAKHERLTLKLN